MRGQIIRHQFEGLINVYSRRPRPLASCSSDAAWQRDASGQPVAAVRRPVVIGGRRIRTVDIHAHCAVPEAGDLLRRAPPAPAGTQAPLLTLDGESLAHRIAAMDAQSIDIAVLSINPELVRRRAGSRGQSDRRAERSDGGVLCRHADRFAAFASVALQFPDLAAQQLEDGVKKIGISRRGSRRQRGRRRARRSEVPSVLGQGRSARGGRSSFILKRRASPRSARA